METVLPIRSCCGDLLLCNTGSVILPSSGGSISRVHSKQEVTSLKEMACYVQSEEEPLTEGTKTGQRARRSGR